jgi:hypothetical protein
VIAVGVASALAMLAAIRLQATTDVTQPMVVGTEAGIVSQVNSTGSGICLTVSGVSEAVCGDLWRTPNQGVPEVGSQVRVWVLRVPADNGTMVDEFVLQPAVDAGGT